jgi:hypothetical protein
MALFRRRELWIPIQMGQSVTAANGANFNIRQWQNVNSAASAIPSWVRQVEFRGIMFSFTTNPVALSFQIGMQPYRTAGNVAFGSAADSEQFLSTTAVQNYNNGSNNYRHYFTPSTDVFSFTATAISDAESTGFFSLLVRVKNNSGGSLTTTSDNWFNGMLLAY